MAVDITDKAFISGLIEKEKRAQQQGEIISAGEGW